MTDPNRGELRSCLYEPYATHHVSCGRDKAATVPLLLAWILTTSDRPTTAVVRGGLALAVLTFGLLCLVGAADHHDLGLSRWKIGSLMLVWYAPAYGVATVTWSQPQVGDATEICVPSVLRALWAGGGRHHRQDSRPLIGPGMSARRFASRASAGPKPTVRRSGSGPAVPWIFYAVGIEVFGIRRQRIFLGHHRERLRRDSQYGQPVRSHGGLSGGYAGTNLF